jgi:hypothetical protein
LHAYEPLRLRVHDRHRHGLATVQLSASNSTGTTANSTTLVVDKLPPIVDATKLAIVRMASGAADTITLAAGAVNEPGPSYPGQSVSAVTIYADASTGAAIATDKTLDLTSEAVITLDATQAVSYPQLWLTATDAAGNESARTLISVGDDTTAPQATSAIVLDGSGAEESAQASTTAMAANWSGFASDTVSYDYNVSSSTSCGGDVVPAHNLGAATSTSLGGLTLSDGATYYSCVRARDKAQNASAWVASSGVSIEATAPHIVSTLPADAATGVDPKAVITLTFSGPVSPASFAANLSLALPSGAVAATVAATPLTVSLTPNAPLRFNMPYTVTLAAGAEAATGEAIAAAQFTFTTRDGVWGAPQAIQSRPGFVFMPRIFFDQAGNGVALWEFAPAQTSTQGALASLGYDASHGWDATPASVDSAHALATAQTPDFAFFADGSGIAEWPGGANVRLGTLSAQHQWSVVDGVPMNTNQALPTVATNGDHWFGLSPEFNSPNYSLTTVHDGAAKPALEGDSNGFTNVAVTTDANGNAVAVWGVLNTLRVGHFTGGATSTWDVTGTTINTEFAGQNPHLAMDHAGNAFASFEQSTSDTSGTFSVYVARYVVGAGWGSATSVSTTATGDDASMLAMNANGDAVIVWRHTASSLMIKARLYDRTSGTWSAEATIGQGSDVALPDVAIDSDGNASVVWLQSNGFDYDLFGARYLARSAAWQPAAQIENDTGNPNHPRIAIDPAGNATVIWERYDGANVNAWVARFE